MQLFSQKRDFHKAFVIDVMNSDRAEFTFVEGESVMAGGYTPAFISIFGPLEPINLLHIA